ncbi:hypothetical protein BR93DRAFT_186206 [Coniochaeta sp. PMI_546]|nr:hypothetical protein BR93DRAFT_186206 [Coniochaeta sp. PMI_546]
MGFALVSPALSIGIFWFAWTMAPAVQGLQWTVPTLALAIDFAVNDLRAQRSPGRLAPALLGVLQTVLSQGLRIWPDATGGARNVCWPGHQCGWICADQVSVVFCILHGRPKIQSEVEGRQCLDTFLFETDERTEV